MELHFKDILMIFVSLPLLFIVGLVYFTTESFIFNEVLTGYISDTSILFLRVTWMAMMAKRFYDVSKQKLTLAAKKLAENSKANRKPPIYKIADQY